MPIVQGGMGVGVSLAGLASAVANQGGVGVISSAGLGAIYNNYSKDYRAASIWGLKEELRKAREATKGIIGVNVMVAMSNFADMVKTAIAEKADIIFSGAGLPLNLPSFLTEDAKTKLAPIVSSARAAKVLCQKWFSEYKYIPDAIVVEGPKAGGHLGYKADQIADEHYSLETLVPEIVAEVRAFELEHDCRIPVIAGGGIYTGEDIYRIMELGAAGVQMGTRFVTTEECDADPAFVPRPGERGAETPEELPVRLHQDLRRDAQPLLHHAGALQRLPGQAPQRLRFLRGERLACREDPVGAGADGLAARGIRNFRRRLEKPVLTDAGPMRNPFRTYVRKGFFVAVRAVLYPAGVGGVEDARGVVDAGEQPADAVLRKMGVDAQRQVAADAVVPALDLIEIFAPRQSDMAGESVDRESRIVDNLLEALPVFEVAFADGFLCHGAESFWGPLSAPA